MHTHTHTASCVLTHICTSTYTPTRIQMAVSHVHTQTHTPLGEQSTCAHTHTDAHAAYCHVLTRTCTHPGSPSSAQRLLFCYWHLGPRRSHPVPELLCSGPYFCLQPSSLRSSCLSNMHDGPMSRCPKQNSRFSPQICCFLIFPISGTGNPFIPITAEAQRSEFRLGGSLHPSPDTQVQWILPSRLSLSRGEQRAP